MMWIEKCDNKEVGGMRVRRRDARIWFMVISLFFAVFLFTFLRQSFKETDEVEAANLANFNPGFIISDYQMGRYDAMTEEEIQAFLTMKNPCDNTDESYYQALTKSSPGAKWHFEDGHFICLSEELFGDGEEISEGETAAHVIWQAAQDYQINPQVIIVLLQKETGLITDRIPNNYDYRKATGYGCPDTAACSSKYYGFKNQVRNAAKMFRAVLDGGWTNYPLGENYIQYNPNAACGGSIVNVQNLATSALYRYTPYQPNEGSLAAGYGTAYCGSYGNRNFYHYFEDWFSGITEEAEMLEEEIKSEQVISDGWYQIYSKKYSGEVIDISGGIKENMSIADIIMYDRNYGVTDNQIFYIKYNQETSYYNIVNPASDLYIDVKGGGKDDSTPMIVFSQNFSCNQDWIVKKDEDGYISFLSRCSNKALDATKNGKIVIYSEHGGDNQKWLLEAVQSDENVIEDGNYQIGSDNRVFDISGGVTRNMTSGLVILYERKNQDNQKFEVTYHKDERSYSIKNPLSGLYLTADDIIMVKKWDGSCSQKWIIEKNDNKNQLFSTCGKKAVSIVKGEDSAIDHVSLTEEPDNFDFNAFQNTAILSKDKTFQIQLEDNTTVDIYGGITSNMSLAHLITYPARTTNNDNQLFKFEYDTDKKAYRILNEKTMLYLDVESSGVKDGSAVIGYNDNGGYCNQLWNVEPDGEGYYIKSTCSKKLLSVSNKEFGGYPELVISGQSDSTKQKWYLIER